MIIRNFFLISALILTILGSDRLASARAKIQLEGGVDGGGGRVLVCKKASGEPDQVRLVDLWEAQVLYDLQPKSLAPTLSDSVDIAIKALKNSYVVKGNMSWGNENRCSDQDCLEMILRNTTDLFFKDNVQLKRLRGIKLMPTEDSYELAKPNGCDFEQVVNYRPDGKILMDQDLFEQLSTIDQTALIIHEAFYSFLRHETQNETNSIRTRRIVGVVMSGQSFSLPLNPVVGEALHCLSTHTPFSQTHIYFFTDPNFNENKFLAPYVESLFGSKLIGEIQPLLHFDFGSVDKEELFSGNCQKEGTGGAIRFSGTGFIEFDHQIQVQWHCHNQKIKVQVTDTKQGMPSRTAELSCNVEKQ
jgi:hypothetical protein